MKILLVISLGYVAGGAEKNVLIIKEGLIARGHEVRVVSADTPGQELFSEYQFPQISKASPWKYAHYLFYGRSYQAMRRAIKDFQPDLVHFHVMTALTPSVLFSTGKIPSIMTIHGPEEFTLNLLLWFMDTHDFRDNIVDTKHFTTAAKLKYAYYLGLQRPLYRLGLRRLKLVIAPSKYMLEATAVDFGRTPMELIYNGLPLPEAQPLPHNQTVLFVGRLVRLKGVEYLVRAFSQVAGTHPKANLHLVGDGAERTRLEGIAKELGVSDRITFSGWLTQAEITKAYANADISVVPSQGAEALGLVAIEAMATGRPVIGARTGGIPELITPGVTGLIVPAADPSALAAAINELLDAPKDKLDAMSQAATAAAQDFSAERFLDRIEAAYQRVTA